MTLKKYFYFTMLLLSSVLVMPACFEDDDVSGGENLVPNPAGDDFYMYVNGEWHESLTNTDVTQGFATEVRSLITQRINQVAQSMDEATIINKSLTHLYNGGQQDNLDRVEEIVEELLADVETKKDAYQAIGKMIGMGLADESAKLYMVFEEDEIHYTIAPSSVEKEEEGEASMASRRSLNKINWKKYKKYAPRSRAAGDVIDGLVEGLGLDLDYMLTAEELDEFIENLENSTLDDLKEFIQDNVEMALLPYCGDEYVQQITDGNIQTTIDYYNIEFIDHFKYSLSYYFNQAYVSEETKEKFKDYGEELRSVFAKRIENAAWLSSQTKQAALNKLESMKLFFGWPDDEYTEEGFANPEGELLVDDIIEVKSSRTRLIGTKLGNNVRDETMMLIMFAPGESMCLTEYNAVNLHVTNTVNIFPAYMMDPEYSSEMDPSELYVSLSTLGHEMAHTFDCEGITFGADGSQTDWWQPEDRTKFDTMAAQFAAQISSLEAAPGVHQNGNHTINENLADLVGLNIAFDALNECLKKNGVTGDELKVAQKDFFECYAYHYQVNYSPEDYQLHLTDVHGFDKIRVNGIVQHMDSWCELYKVVEGDILYLPKEERIAIW